MLGVSVERAIVFRDRADPTVPSLLASKAFPSLSLTYFPYFHFFASLLYLPPHLSTHADGRGHLAGKNKITVWTPVLTRAPHTHGGTQGRAGAMEATKAPNLWRLGTRACCSLTRVCWRSRPPKAGLKVHRLWRVTDVLNVSRRRVEFCYEHLKESSGTDPGLGQDPTFI